MHLQWNRKSSTKLRYAHNVQSVDLQTPSLQLQDPSQCGQKQKKKQKNNGEEGSEEEEGRN